MGGAEVFGGLVVVGFCLYLGLEKIADAIRYKRTDINFKDAIKIIHGTREDFEKAEAMEGPVIPQPTPHRKPI